MTAPMRAMVGVEETSLDLFVDGDPDGEPLLFLHPWFGCWRFWLSTMRLLPDRWCIAPDLYSLSQGPWEGLATPDGLAAAVLASMDSLGIRSVDVVGNSVGGIVAQVLAVEHPERVRRLVLVGTGPYTTGASPQVAAEVATWVDDPDAAHRSGAARSVAVLTHEELEPEEFAACVDIVEAADPHFVGAVLKSCRERDLRADLPRISAPTLVVRGSFDPIRTQEHSAALIAGIAGAAHVEMAGTGHAPFVDDPETFVTELRRFLDG
jgi:3-oxoadipate enol-lactonase